MSFPHHVLYSSIYKTNYFLGNLLPKKSFLTLSSLSCIIFTYLGHKLVSLLAILNVYSVGQTPAHICVPAPTCRKEQFTEYYVENGCRSRRPIKNAICSGTCGSHCCKPRRTKQRQVRLICNDGTSYKKEIEIIRKCRCRRRCY